MCRKAPLFGGKVTPRPAIDRASDGRSTENASGLSILIHSQLFTGAERSLSWHRVGFPC